MVLPCQADKLVPHRLPMLFIDTLDMRTEGCAHATAHLSEESLCISGNRGLAPEYFIEVIAQTIAAANGYDNVQKQKDIMDGFITAIDSFELCQATDLLKTPFPCSQRQQLHIEVNKIDQLDSLYIYEGKVLRGEKIQASAILKVLLRKRDLS